MKKNIKPIVMTCILLVGLLTGICAVLLLTQAQSLKAATQNITQNQSATVALNGMSITNIGKVNVSSVPMGEGLRYEVFSFTFTNSLGYVTNGNISIEYIDKPSGTYIKSSVQYYITIGSADEIFFVSSSSEAAWNGTLFLHKIVHSKNTSGQNRLTIYCHADGSMFRNVSLGDFENITVTGKTSFTLIGDAPSIIEPPPPPPPCNCATDSCTFQGQCGMSFCDCALPPLFPSEPPPTSTPSSSPSQTPTEPPPPPPPTSPQYIPPLYKKENNTLVKRFEYSEKYFEDEIQYNGNYDNNTLQNDFANGMYKLPNSQNVQALEDPFLLTEFFIENLSIPWITGITYFDFEFDTWNSKNIPTVSAYNAAKKKLTLKSSGNDMLLIFGNETIWQKPFYDLVKHPEWGSSHIPDNQVFFSLSVKDGHVEYTIECVTDLEKKYTYTDYLPNHTAYKYDLNDLEFFLGLTDVNIYRDNTEYLHRYSWFAPYAGARYLNYPIIAVSGRHAKIQKEVDCYINGNYSFTANLFVNHFERPEPPSTITNPGNTVRWHLDKNFTQVYLQEQHTARDFDKLYGQWVSAEYDVTLVYYTLDRVYESSDGGTYYEALVKKSVTKIYKNNTVVNLNDFGTSYYGALFYDNIQHIPFQNWDRNISEPITDSTVITANYEFPAATIRYYDVDDNLYGTVTQDMTIFPADLLKAELDRLNSTNPNWWSVDSPKDKGIIGSAVDFFESIFRFLFGGDNVGNGVNETVRREQKQKAYNIINNLAEEHNDTNQFFLPVVYLDINLEDLNKGAYGNAAFVVEEEKNPQWHIVSGDPLRNDLVYFADVHQMYSLQNSNFTMVVNFQKQMTGFDSFAQGTQNFFGWVGDFFGGIFGEFFGGIGIGLDGVWGVVIAIGAILLVIFCFPLIVGLIKALFALIIWPFKALVRKLE